MTTATVTQRIEVTRKNFDFLRFSDKRINILFGSAGSTKSWSIAQYLLLKFYQEDDIRILCTRKTGPALRKSCWLLMNDLVRKYEYLPKPIPNKSDLTLTYGDNIMFFAPLDDPEKFKSFEQLNYIWAEEATELNYHEYLQLGLRCRGENPNGMNKLFFSFNPIDENSFFKDIVDNPPENVAVQHSTYQDNRFLEKEYIEGLEQLKQQDETYWKIYGEGVWATPQNIIYSSYDIRQEWPLIMDEVIYGVDFGTTNPSAVIEIGIRDEELWIRELLYERGLAPSAFIDRFNELEIPFNSFIYADSSMPGMIMEIENEGYRVYPSKKGTNSVIEGIRMVKTRTKHIDSESPNLLKELRGYKWREDRNGNTIDEPVKFNDHAMDALRYAIYTHLGGIKPQIWSLAGSDW